MLEQVADLARRHNLIVFSDEIYDKLILDGTPHIAFASIAPDVAVRNLRRHVQELPRPRMAHRMGYRLGRRRRSEDVYRGRPPPAASSPLRQPSRAVRDQPALEGRRTTSSKFNANCARAAISPSNGAKRPRA